LRLTDPNGGHASWADHVVIAGTTPVDIPLPFAYNDPAGSWRLTATDLLGSTASVVLTNK